MKKWADPVKEIYAEAVHRLGGYEYPLLFGASHVVWEDENFDTVFVKWCLEHIEEFSHSKRDVAVIRWSLEELLKIPEDERWVVYFLLEKKCE